MEKKMKKENENKMRKTAEAHLRSIRISPIKLSAIARSIAYDANGIIADEPTGNLDKETETEIMAIFKDLAKKGKCVIIVTHSNNVAKMADVVYELKPVKQD